MLHTRLDLGDHLSIHSASEHIEEIIYQIGR
jgi:hypothetical protein